MKTFLVSLSVTVLMQVANIVSGFGNGDGAAGGNPGAGGGAAPGIAKPKGFHIFCMNSNACSGVNDGGGRFGKLLLLGRKPRGAALFG